MWSRARFFKMAKLMTKHTLFDREWFADKLGRNSKSGTRSENFISNFQIDYVLRPILSLRLSQTRVILKVKEFTISKRRIRDKFHLQKLGVTKDFFKVKVLSDFDFGDFWRNWLQRHLVGKVLYVQNSPVHYQYVSLVCKTHSKSQEELFDSFFILKWTVKSI